MPELQWLRNLLHLNKPIIPHELWQTCIARQPFIRSLSYDDLQRLKLLSEELLHTKTITGAGGLEITDEIAVTIVAQAALLVLNLTLDLYKDMPGIVVYPSAFVVSHKQRDAAGVMHEWREALAGQAMSAGGSIVLSWEDVISNADFWARRNVVIHEFAHKIDMERGDANGCPPFLANYHQGMQVPIWQQVFAAAFNDFSHRVHRLEHGLAVTHDAHPDFLHHLHEHRPLPLDPYAAKNPAEFFAVASEVFFVAPAQLIVDYPDVYYLLARYYRQETIAHPTKPQD
ncbi:MAG TPA: M90 family metallopeptidase [Burkholderiaceae bacterium]|jgi:Mlc titration factor MtfA (ptsG expression regulator)|nr:M90 family metallopeptidase [Burkholderiaceae bacterium]